MTEKKEKGEMTVSEAGRRGGKTTSEKYGPKHFQKIGKIGGKIGGNTTKERYGHKFYEEIGKKGGAKVRQLIAAGQAAEDLEEKNKE